MNGFRILHFTHTFIPVYGGTTTRLMKLFNRDGNDHYFIVPHNGSKYVPISIGNLEDSNRYENIYVRRVRLTDFSEKNKFLYRQLYQIYSWRRNASELLTVLDRNNYQLIYGHNPMEFAMAAATLAKTKKLPFIFESHGLIMDSLYNPHSSVKRILSYLENFPIIKLEKNIINRADLIVVQTRHMKERFICDLRIKEDKIKIVYNGVNPDEFNPLHYKQRAVVWRESKNLSDKIIISYFGFLDHNNGIPFFLESIAQLSPELLRKIQILIIGRGPYSNMVEKFARENNYLTFLGMVDHKQMPFYYAVSNIFVIPRPSNNATENLIPMKLLEAMAMEKTIIVSNVKGLTEVISDMQNGIIFKTNDRDEFKFKLSDIVYNYQRYEILGKNARQKVLKDYSWEKARSILNKLFKDLIH